jgi:hypothetical protein
MDKKYFQPSGIVARRLKRGSMILFQTKFQGIIYFRRRKSSKTTLHAKIKTTPDGRQWTQSN